MELRAVFPSAMRGWISWAAHSSTANIGDPGAPQLQTTMQMDNGVTVRVRFSILIDNFRFNTKQGFLGTHIHLSRNSKNALKESVLKDRKVIAYLWYDRAL